MRLHDLFEIKTKTKTKTDEPDLSAYGDWFSDFNDDMTGTKNVPQKEKVTTPTLKKAKASQTHKKVGKINIPSDVAQKMASANITDIDIGNEISDAEAMKRAGLSGASSGAEKVKPKTPSTQLATIETMPAVINKEVAAAHGVEPEWHSVTNFPGYAQKVVRAAVRQIFGLYTSTPIEDVQLLANFFNKGPNSNKEINAVGNWVKKNGIHDTIGEMNLEKISPIFNFNFAIYKAKGQTFFLAQDEGGKYIYSWPTKDEYKEQETSKQKELPNKPKELPKLPEDMAADYTDFEPEHFDMRPSLELITQKIKKATNVEINWVTLTELPNSFDMRRFTLLKGILKQLTTHRIIDLPFVFNPMHLKIVMGWLREFGDYVDSGHIEYEEYDYYVDYYIVKALGYSFGVFNDGTGYIVCTWPSSDDVRNLGECSTTAGVIATVSKPLGGIQRRKKGKK